MNCTNKQDHTKNSKISRERTERLIPSEENVSIQKSKEIIKRKPPKQQRCFGSVMVQTTRLIRHRFIQQKLYSVSLEMLFLSIFL